MVIKGSCSKSKITVAIECDSSASESERWKSAADFAITLADRP